MMNTSYEDNFTFLRRQQQQSNDNRERLRASPAVPVVIQNHHASATSLSSEESAFLVPRPKPLSPKDVSSDSMGKASLKTSQPFKR